MADTGRMGEVNLLAKLLASIEDPHGEGVGADIAVAPDGGVAAEVDVPGGDRYRITVSWLGDREAGR